MSDSIVKSEYADLESLSTRITKSALVPESYRGRPDDCLVAMLMGRELGIAPMQALNLIDVVDGRAAPRSRLRQTLAMRHPQCEYFVLVASDTKQATYETKRRGAPQPVRLTYTIEQANHAGLTRKANWGKHPAEMLRARCAGQLADAVYPDAVLGLPPDEVFEDTEVLEAAPTVDAAPTVPAATPPASRMAALKAKLGVVDAEYVEAPKAAPAPAPAPVDAPPAKKRMKFVDVEAAPQAPAPEPLPAPAPVEALRSAWEKAQDFARLYGKSVEDLKATLKASGVRKPADVKPEHIEVLRAAWDATMRQPGEEADVF